MEQPDSIELKVICCKDLKAFNFFQKLNIYVVVSIVNEEEDDDNNSTPSPSPSPSPTPSPTKEKKKKQRQQQKQKTPIDREGDGNPEWNQLMRFDLKDIFSSSSSSFLLLQFDLLSEGTILGDKTIGRVRVPLKDLINEFNGGAVRFVSYQVRTTDGIPNGVLDFSFKPIFFSTYNHNLPNTTNHHSSFVEDNPNKFKFGNESALPLPIGGNTTNGGVDDVPLIYPPPMMPSTTNTNYYPPPPPLETHHHNPSPVESYYPKIDHFHNPSQEIHYPTLDIHSPPSQQFHNPSHPEEVYYPQPQPQPQVDYHHQLPPSPPCCYHHHHPPPPPPPQVAYFPPPPPPLYYPPGPPMTNPYGGGHEFGRRVEGNPNRPVAYDGYPNYWASTTQPIHW